MLLRLNQHRKAQSTLEYVILIVIIIAAVMAMKGYVVKRQKGRLKEGLTSLAKPFEPVNYQYEWMTQSEGTTTTTEYGGELAMGGTATQTEEGQAATTKTVYESESWGQGENLAIEVPGESGPGGAN